MKINVIVLCDRSTCTPRRQCGECTVTAARLHQRLSLAAVILAQLPDDRTIVIQTGDAIRAAELAGR